MCEQTYFIDLRFPKRDLIEILKNRDRKALHDLVLEAVQNFMEQEGYY